MPRPDPFEYFDAALDIRDRSTWNYSADADVSAVFENMRRGKRIKIQFVKKRLLLFFGIFFALFVIVWLRLVYLQLVRGDGYRASAEINRIREVVVKSPRGLIYDRNGEVLLRNIPNFLLTLVPADLPQEPREREQLFSALADLVHMDQKEIEQLVAGNDKRYSYEPIIVSEHVDYETALLMTVKAQQWPGVAIDTIASRDYLQGKFWSPVLGYIGQINEIEYHEKKPEGYVLTDYIGKTGVELVYESTLRGRYGTKQIEVDSLRKERRVIAQEPPVSGNGLLLTLDNKIQQKLGELLEKKMSELERATGAVAVALDPRSGEVLALVSVPSYDKILLGRVLECDQYQWFLADEGKPLFHRAIHGQYPSGSTFKIVVAYGALAAGVVTPNTSVSSTGGIQIGRWFFPDWKAGGHGSTDVRKALAESVNTYFYTVGGGWKDITGLGVDRINTYASLFGLGQPLGIDLDGEAGGLIPTKDWKLQTKQEPWYIGDTYLLSIGQGDVLVTPLQVAHYTSVVASNGVSYRPHLLRSILAPDGTPLQEKQSTLLQQDSLDANSIRVVREGLRQAVTSGSARRLANLPFTVAGKTGSAQAGKDILHAWFTSFAPYEQPEIVLTILIENGGEGSDAAVPVADEFYQWYASYRASDS